MTEKPPEVEAEFFTAPPDGGRPAVMIDVPEGEEYEPPELDEEEATRWTFWDHDLPIVFGLIFAGILAIIVQLYVAPWFFGHH